MNAPYRPQEHAAALSHWTDLLTHLTHEIAALRGDVARLLCAQAATADSGASDPAFDGLVGAAFRIMGNSTWVAAELSGLSLRNTHDALVLGQAIASTGKTSPRALGKYLAARVPGSGALTSDGLEIRRSGLCGGVLAWTIVQV